MTVISFLRRLALPLFFGLVSASVLLAVQPVRPATATLPLDALRAGMEGEVKTVFSGTVPESFKVKVVGIVRNAIGPDKSVIICELTDPRVQSMGATAGMSGSPLYIGGKLAGALSYQVQRFETVRYAGFTPVSDLEEVRDLPASSGKQPGSPVVSKQPQSGLGDFVSMKPVFSLGGISPEVASIMEPHFRSLGIQVGDFSGNGISEVKGGAPDALVPGSAVSAALATGDFVFAATGTVSMVDGAMVTAFGHPMLGVGEVDMPMCSSEIVTILPSSYSSVKLANIGGMLGSFHQDRLTGISGRIGDEPAMIDVSVQVKNPDLPVKSLHFRVVRHAQLAPLVIATGLMQSVMASNRAGLSEGFRVSSSIVFPGGRALADETLYAGPQALVMGLRDLIGTLTLQLYNPYEKIFPKSIAFDVESLDQNPQAVLENFQLSRSAARAGENVEATLSWRNCQGSTERRTVSIPVKPEWIGRAIEVALVGGPTLDEITGHSRMMMASRYRSFDAFLEAQRALRRGDGLYLVVIEKTSLSTDEAGTVPELPSSLERMARQADEARFQRIDAFVPLFEQHLMEGLIVSAQLRRPLQVTD
jgi:hypothetical protein